MRDPPLAFAGRRSIDSSRTVRDVPVVPQIEERVDSLESVMTWFMKRTEEHIAAIRASNARTDAQLRELRTEGENARARADAQWLQMRAESDAARARSDAQWLEMRDESERERKAFNKRMAEISDSVGTLIEDMVAPNAERIAAQVFRDEPAHSIFQRVSRRMDDRSMEIDLLAVGQRHLMIVEAKRRMRPSDVEDFQAKLQQFPEFFPEYAGHALVPVLASVVIDPSLVTHLTRQRVYGLALGDETMELVNWGQF